LGRGDASAIRSIVTALFIFDSPPPREPLVEPQLFQQPALRLQVDAAARLAYLRV
jgi:hypothetical protein